MRNTYPGKCFKCEREIKEGEGFFQIAASLPKKYRPHGKRWVLRCKRCVDTGNEVTKEFENHTLKKL